MSRGSKGGDRLRVKSVLLSAVICLCLMLTSCGLLSQMLLEAAKSDTPAPSEADNELAKYNAYMEFLNFTNEWYEAMCYIYFDEFGMEYDLLISNEFDGFTLDGDDASSSIYEMYADQTYAPRKYLSAAPDYGETDARMLLFCDAFDRFNGLYFRDVNAYYTDKEYELDDFDRGRLFHKRMLEEYEAFAEARYGFFSAFSAQILAKEYEGLEELKEQGNLIHYYTRVLIMDSRAIDDMFLELEYEGIDFLNADLDKYDPLYNQFKSDLYALNEACGNAQVEKERYTGMQSAFLKQFLDTADMMLVAATDARNMIEAGSEDIENEMTGMVGTGGRNYPIDRFRQRMGMLISEYNNSI
jgi:hypothetical protein